MRKAGVANIGIANVPGIAYMKPDGTPGGYMIDVSSDVLKQLGVPKLSATVATFSAFVPGLLANRYDLLPAGMNITPQRCQAVLFSDPLMIIQDAFYTKAGNPLHITSYASVKANPQIHIAVLSGSSQLEAANAKGIPNSQIIQVPDEQSGIATVTGGRADAWVQGEFSVPASDMVGLTKTLASDAIVQGVGVAFRPTDKDLRQDFNLVLAQMRVDGSLFKIYAAAGFDNGAQLKKYAHLAQVQTGCL